MKILKSPLRWIIIAVLFSLIPADLAYQREMILRHGKEVVVNVHLYDPRSLFQGDYVRLSFDFSRLPNDITIPPLSPDLQESVFVSLEKRGSVWEPTNYSFQEPETGAFLQGFLDGRQIIFGIETFFVPENTGHLLEEAIHTPNRVQARLRINTEGMALIENLIIDGKDYNVEPNTTQPSMILPPPASVKTP